MNGNNLKEINSLNQRGGRMLSIIDLIKKDSISIDLCAYLCTSVFLKSSFLFCAQPGNAGKTTFMAAFLGVLPENQNILSIQDKNHLLSILKDIQIYNIEYSTYIVHEIGTGNWFGYLWNSAVKDFLKLKKFGCQIVSNMHQDTLEMIKCTFKSFNIKKNEFYNGFDQIIKIKYDSSSDERKIINLWELNHKKYVPIFENFKFNFQNSDLKFYNSKLFSFFKNRILGCIEQNIKEIELVNNFLYKDFNI